MSEKRQLLAIMLTDIVGYTALMGKNERTALELLEKSRTLQRRLVGEHHGEIIEETGDGILASFRSAVNATDCALAIQRSLKDDPDLKLRIGLHHGDVIPKDGKLVGESVNIAARLEQMSSSGGICVSGHVYESVRNKADVGGIFLGARELKNVPEKVRVYALSAEGISGPPKDLKAAPKAVQDSLRRRAMLSTIIVSVLIAGMVWYISGRRTAPPLPLPDKPAIAVLPFDNMSGDPGQEHLSDGITEEIITGLSKIPKMLVIARNSSFTYKDKPVKVQQVRDELGVHYVLEGSFQRDGEKARVTAQLIDARTGHHLWAERYDREMMDIFSVQDDITKQVVTSLQVELTEGAQALPYARNTSSLDAYERQLQARKYVYHLTPESNVRAKELLNEAIELDPGYATAYKTLAVAHMQDVMMGISPDPRTSISRATELAKKAIELDTELELAHGLLGWLLVLQRRHEEGLEAARRAVELGPGSADSHLWLGLTQKYSGLHEEAVQSLEKAVELNPIPPPIYLNQLAVAYALAGMPEKAVEKARKTIDLYPDFQGGYGALAIASVQLGNTEEAEKAAVNMLRLNPDYSVANMARTAPYRNPEDLEFISSSMRQAGLP